MKLSDIPGYVMMYALAGTFTCALYAFVEEKESFSASEYLGVLVLWPLFIIKYVGMAVYFILSAGFGALV